MRVKFMLMAATAATLFAGAAQAATATTVNSSDLFAGPDSEFPQVERVPDSARVTVYGCDHDYSWCDIAYRGERGWIDANALVFKDQGKRIIARDYGPHRLPVVSFNFTNYWDTNYKTHAFYAERAKWRPAAARMEEQDGAAKDARHPNNLRRD